MNPNAAESVPRRIPITVLIPAYNAERFIGQTLAMLERQTAQPAEIIVVDDGSTDATAAIAEAMGATVIRAAHADRAAARNTGIAAATYDWIALLDADDLWEPTKLAAQWDLHRQHPGLDIIATDYDEIRPDGTLLKPACFTRQQQYWEIATTPLTATAGFLDPNLLARSFPDWGPFLPSSLLLRKSLFNEFGLFNVDVELEDTELLLRFLANCKTAMIEQPLVGYIRHPSSVTANRSNDEALVELCHYVNKAPKNYHPASVRSLNELLPTFLVRLIRRDIKEQQVLSALANTWQTVKSLASLRTAWAFNLRILAKNPTAKMLFGTLPWTHEAIDLIPSQLSHPPRHNHPDWSRLITEIANGKRQNTPDPVAVGTHSTDTP